MSTTDAPNDPLAGWDPRRRAALERIRAAFKDAGSDQTSLSDELVSERRLAAAGEDGIAPDDPDFGVLLPPPGSASE